MHVTSARKSSMVRRLIQLLAACIVCCAARFATAQTVTVPFSVLRAASGEAAAAHALVVELSPREALTGVHLHLALDQAPQPGMRYVVWVNGNQVADTEADQAVQTLAVSTPAFEPGTNSIQLALVPPGAPLDADTARRNAAPVDDARSTLSLDFAGLRAHRAPMLSQLSVAFDRRAWLPRTLSVELAAGTRPAESLRAAAWAVQAVAAQMGHSEVTVLYRNAGAQTEHQERDVTSGEFGSDAARGGDVLIVGPRDALQGKIPVTAERAIAGPFLGIFPANEGKSVVVVISGLTESDCVAAASVFAQALVDRGDALPASAQATVRDVRPTGSRQPRLAVSLANEDPELMQAALNFSAIDARQSGAMTDMDFRFGEQTANAGLYLGSQAALPRELARRLPNFQALRPGQAVSLRLEAQTGASRDSPLVTVLGSDESSVARGIEMLRDPKVWALFSRRSALFDTHTGAASALATHPRSWFGRLRLLARDPAVFWPLLGGLLLIAGFSLNFTLKAHTEKRLGLDTR